MPPPPPTPSTQLSQTPASLSHFVIFNPTLKLSPPVYPASRNALPDDSRGTTSPITDVPPVGERDRDLEDDLKEAAQILFYTSREAGGVSRDRMLRQVGLAKGLMGFVE
jgi:hypothetical protein